MSIDDARLTKNLVSWGSHIFKIDGERVFGLTNVEWDEKRGRAYGYGMNRAGKPLARTSGKYEPGPVKFTFHRHTWLKLSEHLASKATGGKSIGDVEVRMTLQVAEGAVISQTDFDRAVLVTNTTKVEENPDPNMVDREFHVMGIVDHGATLYDSSTAPTDAEQLQAAFLASSAGTWDPLTNPIDYVLLLGKRSPGIADVSGASAIRNWDIRTGFGLSGATVVFVGSGLSKFSVKLRLYSAQDWADWAEWSKYVIKTPGGLRPRALDIWHPFLELFDIKAVVVEEILQPEQTGDGEWTIEIKFIQYRKPKQQYSKPDSAATTPLDAVDLEVLDKDNTIHALWNQLALPDK